MKLPLLAACLFTTVSLPLFAAAAPPVSSYENAVRAREQRVTLLRDEIKALDARIEGRVDALVQALESVADSKETRTKVARMKRDTIQRLEKTVEYYRQKRSSLQEELRRPTLNLTADQKQQIIQKFDARMEKRVAQILELQKSMPANQEYERYKPAGNTWWGTTYEFNEDYQQNRQLTSQTNAQRKEIVAGLNGSISRLDQQLRALKANGGSADDIAKTETLLKERRSQLADAQKPVAPPTRTIGGKEAADLDKALKTAIADLQLEFTTLFARYNAALQEVAALNTARAQLAAAKPKA